MGGGSEGNKEVVKSDYENMSKEELVEQLLEVKKELDILYEESDKAYNSKNKKEFDFEMNHEFKSEPPVKIEDIKPVGMKLDKDSFGNDEVRMSIVNNSKYTVEEFSYTFDIGDDIDSTNYRYRILPEGDKSIASIDIRAPKSKDIKDVKLISAEYVVKVEEKEFEVKYDAQLKEYITERVE